MIRPITVQFLKNPDIRHWGFEAWWIGEDEWGDWIAVPTGTVRWKGDRAVRPTRVPAVFCAPRDQWWHLHYHGHNEYSEFSHFIDIATPPAWVSDSRYEMIDLDLDVAMRLDGSVEVQDEDEFDEHQVLYGYSEEMIRSAEAETVRIVAELERRREPFFEVASAWLAKVDGEHLTG